MNDQSFQQTCDQLSNAVDEVHFERFRWDRDEAPKLARLVELLHGALEDRRDFELTEEGASSASKRFVIKVHGNRTVAIAIGLDNGRAVIDCETIDRSHYSLAPGEPISQDFSAVDEQWIENVLQQIFARIRSAAPQ